jgi:hypothetical protein
VLRDLGDPRGREAVMHALALLEAQPAGPELVEAYAHLAGVNMASIAAFPEALAAADRALALASELGLAEPARALGFRGFDRACLGERQGLEDMRRALELALERGHGRVAAGLYNNLAIVAWLYDGPQAAYAAAREGIDFCERRGITEFALQIGAMSQTFRADLGDAEAALAGAGPAAERLQTAGDMAFIEPRSLQLRLLAACGAHAQAPAADELVARARKSGDTTLCAVAFTTAAAVLLARGHHQQAQALLAELEQITNIRAEPYYASVLSELVRTALAVGDPDLASRLVAGVEPRTPLAQHALCHCRAQLTEATGEHAKAVALYADAAQALGKFGNVPERAHALLGRGRCLAALGRPERKAPLREARDLFASMGYKPALAETEALLARAEAAAV